MGDVANPRYVWAAWRLLACTLRPRLWRLAARLSLLACLRAAASQARATGELEELIRSHDGLYVQV